MKLRTKITVTSLSIVVFSTIVFLLISIYSISRKGEQDIATYRAEETERIKTYLKDFSEIAYETIQTNYKNSTDVEFLKKYYGKSLKDFVNIAESILRKYDLLLKKGVLSEEEAKRLGYDSLREIRYANESGYIIIINMDLPYPTVEMHPTQPFMVGKPFLPATGGNIVGTNKNAGQAAVELCNKQGEAFVYYTWRKPTKDSFVENINKLSYVRKFEEWDIIIVSGIYLDDALEDAKQKSISDIRKMKYADETGYFFIFTNETPYPKLIMSATEPELEGETLDMPRFNCAMGIDKNLFVAFTDICNTNGAGFVDYIMKKPLTNGTFIPDVQKLSYGKLFEPWGWITATGLYLDTMEVKIAEKEREITSQIRNLLLIITFATLIVVLFGFALSYFSAKSIAEPIRVLIQTIKEIDLKALSTTRVELKGSHETEELGGIFNNMIESLSDSVEKLKHTTAEKERIESELHIAREIQMSIIPKIFPAFPERSEFDIYGKLESARAVGGDLFDYMFIDEDQLCFTIGDVSGKGVPASLFMAITSTLVRAEAVGDMPVSEIVDGINSALCVNNDMAMFVTLFMAILNVRTGEMEYCNAGHNPPYLIKNQKEIVKLTDIHGIPVAISENIKYRSSKITINPSDSIVLYTDGVTDADNIEKDFFQEEGLETVLKKSCNLSPKGITDAIFSEVHKFAGDVNQSDDITILALKYKGDSK